MNGWKMMVGIIFIAAIIVISGCTSTENITAEKIKSNILQAIKNVSSYKYSTEGTITMSITNASGVNTTETTIIQLSEVDVTNKKLKIDQTSTETKTSTTQHILYYLVNKILYTGTETNGQITWTHINTSLTDSEQTWMALSQLERQMLILENASVEQLADDVIEGVSYYVLNITLNLSASSSSSDNTVLPVDGFADMMKEMDIKYWIDKDTYQLKKATLKVTMDLNWMGMFQDATSALSIQDITLLCYDYDIPVTIDVPPDALQ